MVQSYSTVLMDLEVTKLISVFRKSSYQLPVINNAYFKARKCFYSQTTREHEQYQHTLVLPSICNTTIRKLFNNNVQIYFKPNYSTQDLLHHSVTIRLVIQILKSMQFHVLNVTVSMQESLVMWIIDYISISMTLNVTMNSPLINHIVDNNPSIPMVNSIMFLAKKTMNQ